MDRNVDIASNYTMCLNSITMSKTSVFFIFVLSLFVNRLSADEAPDTLHLQTAIDRVLTSSALLKTARLEIEVKNAEAWQDSLYPNPEATIEIDSFGGRHECHGFDSSEVSYSISQLILLGGKRGARLRVDAASSSIAEWDYKIAEQDALLELTHCFIDAYLAQEKLHLAKKQHEVAEKSGECVREKEAVGKATALEKKKAAVNAFTCKIAVDKAESDFEAAKRKLALLWGADELDFVQIAFPLYEIREPSPIADLNAMLPCSPELAKAETNVQGALAAIDFEKAQSVPDLAVSVGTGGLHDFSNNAFFVSFSMPIPIFDRNQGNICRASLQSWQAAYARESSAAALQKNFNTAYRAWVDAYKNARAYLELEQNLAAETFQTTEESYKQGKVELQDLLDAKKTWLDTRSQTLDAAADYHNKKAETLRLTGQM